MAAGIWYIYNERQEIEFELQRCKQQVTALTAKIEDARLRKNRNQNQKREQRRILPPPESNMDGRSSDDLNDSSTTLYVNECGICYDAEVDAVVFPCCHSMSCLNCALLMKSVDGKCSFCRTRISKVEQIFTGHH